MQKREVYIDSVTKFAYVWPIFAAPVAHIKHLKKYIVHRMSHFQRPRLSKGKARYTYTGANLYSEVK